MKKLLLTATLLITSFLSIAQNQPVPNGDFENWLPFSFCPTIDSLEGYITYDEFIFTETGSCSSYLMAKKSTDKYAGNYALELNPYFDGTDYLSSGVYSSIDLFETAIQGVPFASIPNKLTGYYKFNQGVSDDNLYISVQVSDQYGYSIGDGYLFISETVSTYTQFEIILENSNNNTNPPHSLVITFLIGNTFYDTASPLTQLVIDNLQFDYPTTATTAYSTTSPVNVYTTLKNINFSNEVSDVVIYNLVGSQELNQTTSTKTVNAANLKSGLYVVTYKYNDNFYSKKVVVE